MQTFTRNGDLYEIQPDAMDAPTVIPDAFTKTGFKFLVSSSPDSEFIIEPMLHTYHESCSMAETLMDVVQLTVDGHEVDSVDDELWIDRIVQYSEPSTGPIAFAVHMSNDPGDETTVAHHTVHQI